MGLNNEPSSEPLHISLRMYRADGVDAAAVRVDFDDVFRKPRDLEVRPGKPLREGPHLRWLNKKQELTTRETGACHTRNRSLPQDVTPPMAGIAYEIH